MPTFMDQRDVSTAPACSDLHDDKSSPVGARPSEPERAGYIHHSWRDSAGGVVAAGSLYSIALCSLVAVVAFWNAIMTLWDDGAIGTFILTALLIVAAWGYYSAMGATLGLLAAVFVAGLTLPIVFLILRSLRVMARPATVGAFLGGLVGFIATVPAVLVTRAEASGDWRIVAIAVALGPGLATIFGQIGGAWGGWKARAVPGHSDPGNKRTSCDAPHGAASSVHVGPQRPAHPAFQFDIRQLLWMAFWLSLLMSVIRLLGVPFEVAIPLLVGWTIYQFATLAAGAYLVRRLRPWWAARQRSRST